MEHVWCLERALAVLDVELVEFHSDGPLPAGAHGWRKYCRNNKERSVIAINPDTHLPPDLIAFHELGHIVLEHGKMSLVRQWEAYADMEVAAMKVALALGRDLLPDSVEQWRMEVEDYITGFIPNRLAPESDAERTNVAEAIEVIRTAGLVADLVSA